MELLRVPGAVHSRLVKKIKSQKIKQNHKNIDDLMVKRFEEVSTLCSRQWNVPALFWI
jgi:hypothetical protein